MKALRSLLFRLGAPFRRRRFEAEMSEEMQTHLEMQTEANLAAGMPPAEALRAARLECGGLDQAKEAYRDERGIPWIEDFLRDLRFAVRSLAKSPGFTAVAVLSLALGIGANTAMFSLLNAVLLRALPVHRPHELRVIEWAGTNPALHNFTGSMGQLAPGRRDSDAFPFAAYRDFRDRAAGLAGVFAFFTISDVTTVTRTEAGNAEGLLVTGNFFSVYGAPALIGRPLREEDDRPGAPPAAVITYRFWERHYGLDPGVLGQTLGLNQMDFTVVGVLPREYVGPRLGDTAEFYVPMAAQPQLARNCPLNSYNNWWVQIMARMAPGATDAQVQMSLAVLFCQALAQSDTRMDQPDILLEDGSRGPLIKRERMAPQLLGLQGVAITVLLIACANLAGLLTARAAARRHELAVRVALGASRARLVRQSLAESFVLALVGAGLALLFGVWIRAGLLATIMSNFDSGVHLDTRIDARVLLFTTVIALATAVLSGLLPALRAARVDPAAGLQGGRRSGGARPRLGGALVVTQVALSFLLATGAGLFLRSLGNLRAVDLGFNPENLLVFRLNAGQSGYQGEKRIDFYDRVRETLVRIPGVRAVALADRRLVAGGVSTDSFSLPGRPAPTGEHLQANVLTVSDAFFTAMGIPLPLGRSFAGTDTANSQPVIIVNDAFARTFLPGVNPIGQVVKVSRTEFQIVGVCRDTQYQDLKSAKSPMMVFAYRQAPPRAAYFTVRSVLPPLSLGPAARRAVTVIDATVPLVEISSQADLIERTVFFERLFSTLCGCLAGLALLLCCIGLYGLLAYNVARRTREIGIRMALGARAAEVARAVVGEALALAAWGLAAGLPLAVAIGLAARTAFFGVSPYDAGTLLSVTSLLLLVAVIAAWVPARRAARVNPVEALRTE